MVLTGVFGLAYVPSALGLSGDNRGNALLIFHGQALYRLGLLALLVNQVAFLVLPLALWRVLHAHGEAAAVLMVAFAAAGVPLALVAVSLRLDAVGVLAASPDGGIVRGAQTAAAMALDMARNRMLLATVFWGLWLAPLGWLVWRSRIAPRAFAVLLMLGCLGYLVQAVAAMLAVELPGGLARLVRAPASLGEIGFCLWLVLTAGRFPGWWPGKR